ncbi:uncharacterized protein [Prorops nasuta]|uniref:uncharacterized protein n=1 Tax=Prorops nasuta TaxID=863751 RepID=UPI0034CFD5D8
MPIEPKQIQSLFSPDCELDKLQEFKSAIENFIQDTRIYYSMLVDYAVTNISEENIFPWKTLKDGSYYLREVYYLVELCNHIIPGTIKNKIIQSIITFLEELEFEPHHISEGYTPEAYNGIIRDFVSSGKDTNYYKLLYSQDKKDISLFIIMICIKIEIPIREFLMSINQSYHEKILKKSSGAATVQADKNKFEVILNVQDFDSKEILIKVVDKSVVIEGKHEEKQDEHGLISRQFTRKYLLPVQYDIEQLKSTFSSDAVLTICAPRKEVEAQKEMVIQIKATGEPALTTALAHSAQASQPQGNSNLLNDSENIYRAF